MGMQIMQVPTTTLPSFAAAARIANNLDATTSERVISRLDGSDAMVGKVKGQNGADGHYDVVVVKVGLKFGKNSAAWGGNCKTSTTKSISSSSSAAAAAASVSALAQYEHDGYGDEQQHDFIVSAGNVVNLARSTTITESTTMGKKKDGTAVKNTILLRGSSKPLACCVM